MLKNTASHYGRVAQLIHWAMAALFIGMYTVAYIMINIDRSPFRFTLYDLHKATGLLLLMLVTLRLIWRLTNLDPALQHHMPAWQKRAARLNIMFLYFCMFFMPISGVLTSTTGGHEIKFYNLFSISPLMTNAPASAFFSGVHEWLSWGLVALFSVHVLAALYHHYYLKDDVLRSITSHP